MRSSISGAQLSRLLRSPAAMSRYMATGRLPDIAKPDSPLIRALKIMSPHDRLKIRNLNISPALGYSGSRRFQSAAQALNWLSPSYTAQHYPSQSWQIRNFTKVITLDDLLANSGPYTEAQRQSFYGTRPMKKTDSQSEADETFTFAVRINITEPSLCIQEATDHHQLENPSLEEALYVFLVNPDEAPVNTGFELLQGTQVVATGDKATLTVVARVFDKAALHKQAEAVYRHYWNDDINDKNPRVEDLIYEVLIASNDSPSPCDIGYEIGDIAYNSHPETLETAPSSFSNEQGAP